MNHANGRATVVVMEDFEMPFSGGISRIRSRGGHGLDRMHKEEAASMTIPNSIVGHVTTVFGKGRNGERLGLGFRPVKPPTEQPIPSLMLIDTKLPEEHRTRLFQLAALACTHQLLVEVTSSTGTAESIDEIEIWNHE